MDHGDGVEKIGTDPIHFIDQCNPGYIVFVGLAPYGFRLGLYTCHTAEYPYSTIQNPQCPFNFNGEIHMSGGINNVNPGTLPLAGGHCRSDGDSPILLILHPVHDSLSIMHFSDLVGFSGIIENPFSDRGLARINVGHNPYISYVFYICSFRFFIHFNQPVQVAKQLFHVIRRK